MEWLKKIFINVIQKIVGWYSITWDVLRDNSGVAVKVVDSLKNAVESPVADIVTAIIPSDVDDKIKAKLEAVLPVVAEKLAIAYGIIQISDKNTDSVAALIGYLKTINKDARVDFWIRLSGELNVALADGKISLSEAISIAQFVYSEKKKSNQSLAMVA